MEQDGPLWNSVPVDVGEAEPGEQTARVMGYAGGMERGNSSLSGVTGQRLAGTNPPEMITARNSCGVVPSSAGGGCVGPSG